MTIKQQQHIFRSLPVGLRLALFLILAGTMITSPVIYGQATKPELPKAKQTTLGLYVTATEAYEKWKASPDKVKILDVRTPEEYFYIGHPSMAWNVPVAFQSYIWDAEKQDFPLKPNPDFVTQVKKIAGPDEIILVTCRSGTRSAMAVNQLAAAGYKNAFNITDGFEGEKVTDTESTYYGQRMKNGWKNSGIPWTYKIDPKLMSIVSTK